MMQKANVSLTTVIIIGAVLLTAGIILLNSTLDLIDNSKIYTNTNLAQINARTCLEEALARIKADSAYTGNSQLTIDAGSCTFSVTDYQNQTTIKLITTSGSVSGTTYSLDKLLDTTQNPFQLSSL